MTTYRSTTKPSFQDEGCPLVEIRHHVYVPKLNFYCFINRNNICSLYIILSYHPYAYRRIAIDTGHFYKLGLSLSVSRGFRSTNSYKLKHLSKIRPCWLCALQTFKLQTLASSVNFLRRFSKDFAQRDWFRPRTARASSVCETVSCTMHAGDVKRKRDLTKRTRKMGDNRPRSHKQSLPTHLRNGQNYFLVVQQDVSTQGFWLCSLFRG